MNSYNSTLRAALAAAVKTPADPRVTGAILQAQLLSIVDAIDRGGIFLGLATPATVPTTEANCFFLATTAGTYTNFLNTGGNAITIAEGESALIKSSIYQENLRWTKTTIAQAANGSVLYSVDQELTPEQKSRALANIGGAVAVGENPDLIAGDITAKSSTPVDANGEFDIQTTGGDTDLKSGASLLKVIRGNLDSKLNPFLADIFVSTGMNLVDPEQTLTIDGRTAYYFPIAKGTWGSYGTTQENNGYIVIGDEPYAVCFSEDKPTVGSYGSALTPVTSNGKKYYTTSGNGWLVVIMNDGSEIPAVHIAWSNYNDDVAGVFGNATKNIAPFVQWIHAWGMASLVGNEYAVFDEINVTGQTCYRRTDRVALGTLEWIMTAENAGEDERATYVFTATVSAMKSGGLFAHNNTGMEVSGNTLTCRSTEINNVSDFVTSLGGALMYYELETVVARTFAQIGSTLTEANVSNDFGLTYFLNAGEIASVKAYVSEAFQQGGKDQLFNAVTYQKILAEVVASALCQVNERLGNLENRKDIVCENLTVERRASITGWREVDAAPASASAAGTPGNYFVATDYIYICVAENTWKRTALSTF